MRGHQEQDKNRTRPRSRAGQASGPQHSTTGFDFRIRHRHRLSPIANRHPLRQPLQHYRQHLLYTSTTSHTPPPPNDQANSTGYRIATLSNSLQHLATSPPRHLDQDKSGTRAGQDRDKSRTRATRPRNDQEQDKTAPACTPT